MAELLKEVGFTSIIVTDNENFYFASGIKR